MKIFAFLTLLVSATMLFAFSQSGTEKQLVSSQNSNNVVMVSVQHFDGTTSELKLLENQLLSDIPHFENVTTCTYMFSDGSCKRTANTCAEARVLFAACACAAGHERFCNAQK